MIPDDEPEIKREDSTPKLVDQCTAKGWEFGVYDFGKAEAPGVTYFNPGLVQREDGLWLLVRRSQNAGRAFGMSDVWAIMLDEAGRVPKMGQLLKWTGSMADQQHEDARAFYHPDIKKTCVGSTTFIWRLNGTWTGAHQEFAFYDEGWNCVSNHHPVFGGNAAKLDQIEPKNYEKSWLWFLHHGKLHLLYKANPWTVVEYGDSWESKVIHRNASGATWKWGEIRNGTPPILIDGLFYTIFHSSLPWQGNYRRYYAGALAFESEPPYTPVMITPEPLLLGSQNDEWSPRKPPCVFPCGAVVRNGKWLVTAGQNDLKAIWFEFTHESLLSCLRPIVDTVTPIFPVSGLSEDELRKNRLRENAARARAALADKRRNGTLGKKRKNRRLVLRAKNKAGKSGDLHQPVTN